MLVKSVFNLQYSVKIIKNMSDVHIFLCLSDKLKIFMQLRKSYKFVLIPYYLRT